MVRRFKRKIGHGEVDGAPMLCTAFCFWLRVSSALGTEVGFMTRKGLPVHQGGRNCSHSGRFMEAA